MPGTDVNSSGHRGARRFVRLWQRLAPDGAGNDPRKVHARLVSGYGEPGRFYHTMEHIDFCLRQFDAAAERMERPDEVEMAIWFHDVVYSPGAPDNERRSAELFTLLAAGSMSIDVIARIETLILATIHPCTPSDQDAGLLVDIDLSSFGQPWKRFLRDSVKVRRELAHLDDAEYYPSQMKFFDKLMADERFCVTDFFAERHEAQARRNIERYRPMAKRRGG